MNRRIFDLAKLMVDMPEWLAVRAVTIESAHGVERLPVPFPPGFTIPIPEGPFTIRVEIDPA